MEDNNIDFVIESDTLEQIYLKFADEEFYAKENVNHDYDDGLGGSGNETILMGQADTEAMIEQENDTNDANARSKSNYQQANSINLMRNTSPSTEKVHINTEARKNSNPFDNLRSRAGNEFEMSELQNRDRVDSDGSPGLALNLDGPFSSTTNIKKKQADEVNLQRRLQDIENSQESIGELYHYHKLFYETTSSIGVTLNQTYYSIKRSFLVILKGAGFKPHVLVIVIIPFVTFVIMTGSIRSSEEISAILAKDIHQENFIYAVFALISLLLANMFSLPPCSILKVQEHENRMRYILTSNRGQIVSYLLGLMIPDFLLMLFTTSGFQAFVKICFCPDFFSMTVYLKFCLQIPTMLFTHQLLCFYTFSYFFDKEKKYLKFIGLQSQVPFGLLLWLTVYGLWYSEKTNWKIISHIFSPYFCFFASIFDAFPENYLVDGHPQIQQWIGKLTDLPIKGYWPNFAMLLFQLCQYLCLIFICDKVKYKTGRLPPNLEANGILPTINIMDLEKKYKKKKDRPEDQAGSDLSESSNSLKAVDKVNITIRRGESYIVVGPNGAGKSSILNIQCRIDEKSAGQIMINDIYQHKHNYNNIGFCLQSDYYWEGLTLDEHVSIFLGWRGLKKCQMIKIKDNLLKCFSLYEFRKTKANDLSGGTKRKLNMVQSLLGCPSILILDEPTAGVDPVSRRQCWKALNYYRRLQTCTFFITSHTTREAEEIGDSVGILSHGKLLKEMDLRNLKNNSFILEIKSEVGQNSIIGYKEEFQRSFTDAKVVEESQYRLGLEISNDKVSIADLMSKCEEQKVLGNTKAFSYSIKSSTLEHLFFKYIKKGSNGLDNSQLEFLSGKIIFV